MQTLTRRIYTPRPYQQTALAHLIDTPRCALWAGMGMGKTSATLTALDILFISGESAPALVLAPLRVARSTWPTEARKWEHLKGIEVSAIVGSEIERKAALRNGNANVFSVNYENVPWLVDQLGDRWPFGTVVADESTKLKGFRLSQGTARAKAIARVAHKNVKRWINLTGTPSPNGLVDLWGQTWFIDGGHRLGRSFNAFQNRWFQSVPGGDGYTQLRALPFAQEQIQERLRDVCLTLDPREYFDLKEPIHNVIQVDLPARVRNLYRDMERELFMQIEGHDIEAFNAASRTMKCLQLCNGEVAPFDWTECFMF